MKALLLFSQHQFKHSQQCHSEEAVEVAVALQPVPIEAARALVGVVVGQLVQASADLENRLI